MQGKVWLRGTVWDMLLITSNLKKKKEAQKLFSLKVCTTCLVTTILPVTTPFSDRVFQQMEGLFTTCILTNKIIKTQDFYLDWIYRTLESFAALQYVELTHRHSHSRNTQISTFLKMTLNQEFGNLIFQISWRRTLKPIFIHIFRLWQSGDILDNLYLRTVIWTDDLALQLFRNAPLSSWNDISKAPNSREKYNIYNIIIYPFCTILAKNPR